MVSSIKLPRLPLIDLSIFDLGDPWRDLVAAQVDSASSHFGFFYLLGHGIDTAVVSSLLDAGRRYCALAKDQQEPVALERERAVSATSVLGQILVPEVPGFLEPVMDYTRSLTGLAHKLMSMFARGLLLKDSYFVDRYTGNPATSFRILNDPQITEPHAAMRPAQGLLTIIRQDLKDGLELRYRDRWINAPDIPDLLVCAVGATLARLTNGRYVAAAHRMRNSAQGQRPSLPFCFDVSPDSVLEPIEAVGAEAARAQLHDATAASWREA